MMDVQFLPKQTKCGQGLMTGVQEVRDTPETLSGSQTAGEEMRQKTRTLRGTGVTSAISATGRLYPTLSRSPWISLRDGPPWLSRWKLGKGRADILYLVWAWPICILQPQATVVDSITVAQVEPIRHKLVGTTRLRSCFLEADTQR